MDLRDLHEALVREEAEAAALQRIDEEILLFDMTTPPHSGDEESEDSSEEPEVPKEIAFSAPGIPFFKNSMFSLYTEDTLLWQMFDDFLRSFDSTLVNEGIICGLFKREFNHPPEILKYLFHKTCCAPEEKLRLASYDSLCYVLTTCTSVSCFKDEFFLALINLGGDLSILERDVLSYKSSVIPEPSPTPPKENGVSQADLQFVLALVLRFLSQCFQKCKNVSWQDADELLIVFIAIGLDPIILDKALDAHIAACISHVLTLYSSDQHFSKRLKKVVDYIGQYCNGDLPSVVHVCQAYISPTDRGLVLRSAVAFQHLVITLELTQTDFVDDVQVKNINDLLTVYFEEGADLHANYDTYYIIKLIDLCFNLDILQLEQKRELTKICDLIDKRFRRKHGNADDLNPTISFQYVIDTLSKWRRYAIS